MSNQRGFGRAGVVLLCTEYLIQDTQSIISVSKCVSISLWFFFVFAGCGGFVLCSLPMASPGRHRRREHSQSMLPFSDTHHPSSPSSFPRDTATSRMGEYEYQIHHPGAISPVRALLHTVAFPGRLPAMPFRPDASHVSPEAATSSLFGNQTHAVFASSTRR